MKYSKIIFVLSLLLTLSSQAFSISDSIRIEPAGLGGVYYSDYRGPLGLDQIEYLVRDNEDASNSMNWAQFYHTFSNSFAFVGGGLIGWPIGTYVGGGEPNWNLAFSGLVVTGIAFGIGALAAYNLDNAVEIYNEGIAVSSQKIEPELFFAVSPAGIGLSLSF